MTKAEKIEINGQLVEVQTIGFRGGLFDRYYVQQDRAHAPGFFVFGRNPAYGDSYIMLCARPAVKARGHRSYNNPVRRGWKLFREAQAIADAMNKDAAANPSPLLSLPLHGTVFQGELV